MAPVDPPRGHAQIQAEMETKGLHQTPRSLLDARIVQLIVQAQLELCQPELSDPRLRQGVRSWHQSRFTGPR